MRGYGLSSKRKDELPFRSRYPRERGMEAGRRNEFKSETSRVCAGRQRNEEEGI